MRLLFSLGLCAFLMSGCGGGSTSTSSQSSTNATKTGRLIDSAVGGIGYRTESKSGFTNSLGEFNYLPGETITFFIGNLNLPSAIAKDIITPLDLAKSNHINNQTALNISILLQSLDVDNDPSNGIHIKYESVENSAEQINFDQNTNNFRTSISTLATTAGNSVVTEQNAINHLQKTLTSFGINFSSQGISSAASDSSVNSIAADAVSSSIKSVVSSSRALSSSSKSFSSLSSKNFVSSVGKSNISSIKSSISSVKSSSSSKSSVISKSSSSIKSAASSSKVSSSKSSLAASSLAASSLSSAPQLNANFEYEARDLMLSVDDANSTGTSAIATYTWTFGDGGSATGKTPPPHTYAVAGTYEVTLTIATANGYSASVTQQVSVAEREIGSYAPSNATTGVPDIIKDRLYTLDLQKKNVSSTNTPRRSEETLKVTLDSQGYKFTVGGSAIQIPAEFAYVKNGRLIMDRLYIRGYVALEAKDITIQRSIIEAIPIPEAPVAEPPLGINGGRRLLKGANVNATNIVVQDVELHVPVSVQRGPEINTRYHHEIGVEASNMMLQRVEIEGTIDGMQIHEGEAAYTNVVIKKSWIHDMQYYSLDWDRKDKGHTHSDGIQVECSMPKTGNLFGARLLGNTIDMTNDPNLNASVMVTINSCATQGLQIASNYFDGTYAPINIGGGDASASITFYANNNRFGPNRTTGDTGSKSWSSSTTDRVMVVKSNNDSSAAYENYSITKKHTYTYFSYDPPTAAGLAPPTGETNSNVIVEHEPGQETWGDKVLAPAKIGLY